ncbi:hypothetical protein BKA65DRAFT_541676 [Rhexocercosporidium sp. MPI-PUGE-AT-0058]|nr:hypothetical protein BKA65DRAFT_541676 [Rhexocercosporidium sp. MPI-PUGE-AT-0058]
MLSTRFLPPQFLLPAWSARQLAQAAQRAHKSDYTKGDEDNDNIEPAPNPPKRLPPTKRARLSIPNVKKIGLKPINVDVETNLNSRQSTPEEQSKKSQARKRVRKSDSTKKDSDNGDHYAESIGKKSSYKLFTPIVPPGDVDKVVGKAPAPKEVETQSMDQEPQAESEGLSLYEELFPEEALARQTREKKARERLEKLPAFNWAVETTELDMQERKQEEARKQTREKFQTIPGLKFGRRTVQERTVLSAKQEQDESSTSRRRASVLVLQACSKTLEESDFYRVGPKGNHIESWTNGILKIIPARDNVTLEPLGQYFILFSSLAAARLYLDKTLRLLALTTSSEYFSRPSARSREGEDLEAVKRNFTLVPAGGKLSLRLLQPPYSKGLQWMINAGGPAPLVARQNKSQNIVLFSTDRGYVKPHELENAIMDDGKRRNLHWKLVGGKGEAIVQLGTKRNPAGEDTESRSSYRGPARYTVSFKDSNEARRFAREWHKRPFPSKRLPQPGDDAPPIVNTEILW